MDDLKKQIDAARKEGYQDDEIMGYLSALPGVDYRSRPPLRTTTRQQRC